MEINQLVALRIKEIRTNQGITCKAMADDLGITIGSYSATENVKVHITLERLHHIGQILKMSTIAFLPEGALNYTLNVSHGERTINAAKYHNYQDKEMTDAF
jgi:transcriptional regulator with XRE-family HTH domain